MGWCRPRPCKTSWRKVMKSFKEYIAEATVTWQIDHINSVGDIEKKLKGIGAKIVSMRSTRDGVFVKFSGNKNKIKKLVLHHDKDAVER